MTEALDIGLEIKVLRERLKLSSKDLAAKVGLSQSQMSRLEKGQRRIDTTILHKISEALGVDPSFFFRDIQTADVSHEANPASSTIQPTLKFDQIGKLVRSERRKRHFSVDELAQKVGRTKAYMAAFEEGKHALEPELANKLVKALKVTPNFFLEAQQEMLKALEAQVARLDQALAEAHRGKDSEGENNRQSSIPLLGFLSESQRFLFDQKGHPVKEPEDFLVVPGFNDSEAFAITVAGDAMEASSGPSFREGDIIVFTPATIPRSRDLALLRLKDDTLVFRKIFFENDASVRLQPLNIDHASRSVARSEVISFFSVALHVGRS